VVQLITSFLLCSTVIKLDNVDQPLIFFY
jgi:hypothetical protein